MPIPYPTNQYTTIDLTVDNIADFREKRIKPIVDVTTGLTTTDHPTRTLYDFATLSSLDYTDWIWALIGGSGTLINFSSALAGLSVEQTNYFVKEKQLKLLRLTERMRKIAFELQRLNNEALAAASTSTQHLPSANESMYPSSQTIRSFLNR